MHSKGRVDDNQGTIVEALRRIGAEVNITSNLGGGFPDIVVSFRDMWFMIEIKDGDKTKSKKLLTPQELDWHMKQKAPVYIVESATEAIDILTDEKVRATANERWRERVRAFQLAIS